MSLLWAATATAQLGRPYAYSGARRPFSFTGWMRSTILPNLFHLGFGNLNASSTNYAALLWHVDNGTGFSAVNDEKDGTTEQFAFAPYGGANTNVAPVNVWWFGAAVFSGLSARYASLWQAGVISPFPVVSSAGAVVAAPFTHVMVGSMQAGIGNLSNTGSSYLAEACYWDAELGYADLAALAQGANPLSIGPRNNLVDYWPLRGDLKNYGSSEIGLRELGTAATPRTWGQHPPVMPPPRGRQFFVQSASLVTRRPFVSVAS